MYPVIRMRRNRKAAWIRELVAETKLSPSNLILPIFVMEGHNQKQPIHSMPGVFCLSIDNVVETAKEAEALGISAIALFPKIAPELKSHDAQEAYSLDNLMCRTIRALKNAGITIGIICDVALDPYTIDGNDGIVGGHGDVDNDMTIDALCSQALVLAKAGADVVSPSDMMDGRVKPIRATLDKEDFKNVNIFVYATKYNSGLYGPFREVLGGNIRHYLDKATYQMDYRNIVEAMREIEQDVDEGADMVIVKPGLPYLDVINQAVVNFNVNVLAYQVSGEYAMLKFAAQAGALNWEKCLIETLTAFRRAGARGIFTYAALDAARILNTE